MGSYKSFWHHESAGTLMQVRITPYGWDDKAYFVQEIGKLNGKAFKKVKEISFKNTVEGESGAKQVVELFLNLRKQLKNEATEIFTANPLVLFPKDIISPRAKTFDECLLDEALLRIELDQFDQAEQLLKQVTSAQPTLFAHSVARRLYANKVFFSEGDNKTETDAWQQLAVKHAQQIHAATAGQDLYELECYGFGGDYDSANKMVAFAAETLGYYFLDDKHDAALALAALEVGERTYHSGTEAWTLKVRALLQLSRIEEAFILHHDRKMNCAEVLAHPGYPAFLNHAEIRKQKAVEPSYHISFPNAYGYALPSTQAVLALQAKYHFSDQYVTFLQTQNGFDFDKLPQDVSQASHAALATQANAEESADLRTLFGLNNGSPYYELQDNAAYFDMLALYFFPIGNSHGGNTYVEVLAGKYKGYIGSLDHEMYLGCSSLRTFVKDMELKDFFKKSLAEQADALADEDLGLLWVHAKSMNEFIKNCIHSTPQGSGFVEDMP